MVYKGKSFDPNHHLKKNSDNTMGYKGKHFDPNYHLKKNTDRGLKESNSKNNTNYYQSNNNSNNYHSNSNNYNLNDSFTLPPPPRWMNGLPPNRTSSLDDNLSRSTRASSRPRLEDSVDRRSERSSSRNYDDTPSTSRRYDNAPPPRLIDGNNNSNNNNNNNTISSRSSVGGSAKKHKTPLEKQREQKNHLARNPQDKQAHADAHKTYDVNVREAPKGRERSGTPALAPKDNCMDDTDKGEAEPQQQDRQQQQQWSSLSTQGVILHQDSHQDPNTMEKNHHCQNKIRQSSVATTSSVTTTATPTDNQNPWVRSPSILSSSSQALSPASSTVEIHPELLPNLAFTQPYNWTDQGQPGTVVTKERLPSETVQTCQQSEKAQQSQSQSHPQLDNVMTMTTSLALQAVDEKINYLDHLWRAGNDKLSQSVKVAEQSVLTCVLGQVVEEVRIFAVLRETLQNEDFRGQIGSLETLTEMIRQLEARRKFDITCLQPGVPVPDIPLNPSILAMDAMAPLLATSNGVESTTTPVPEVAAPLLPPDHVEVSATVSSDQLHLANSSNSRKRALEQTDIDQTQGSRAAMYHDMDSSMTDVIEGPDLQTSNNPTVHQTSLDTTTTTPTTITTLPALDRPCTSSSVGLQVASTTSSSSFSLNSRSSSISSTPMTSNNGRVVMDIEKELRLIREEGQEQRLRTDQLLAQLESEARLRREADHRVSQLTQELQNERHLTLEKDLELKRSEALLMMAKARKEIQQGKVLIAQAKEELALERAAKAEAMIKTARIEVERNRLLAYVQSLGGPSAAMPGGLFMGGKPALPPTSVTNLSVRFPSPAGSDGGERGVLAAAPGSGGPPSLVDTEIPSGQVNRDCPIEATAIPVKVEDSL